MTRPVATTMDGVPELLPCPFCGGRAERRTPDAPHGGMVNCVTCGAEAFGPKWNDRATRPPAGPDVEEAQELLRPGDIEPHDDKERSVRVVRAAYDWTVDAEGRVCGLVAGDMGYESTHIVINLDELRDALWLKPEAALSALSPDREEEIRRAVEAMEDADRLLEAVANDIGVDGDPCDAEDLCGHRLCNEAGCFEDKRGRLRAAIAQLRTDKNGRSGE